MLYIYSSSVALLIIRWRSDIDCVFFQRPRITTHRSNITLCDLKKMRTNNWIAISGWKWTCPFFYSVQNHRGKHFYRLDRVRASLFLYHLSRYTTSDHLWKGYVGTNWLMIISCHTCSSMTTCSSRCPPQRICVSKQLTFKSCWLLGILGNVWMRYLIACLLLRLGN